MSVKERLKEFAKSQERSIRAFESKAGLGYGYINAIRISIQPDKIKSIASNYPHLNIDWLLTGYGKMLNEEGGSNSKVSPEKVITEQQLHGNNILISREVFEMMNKLADTVQSQQRTIESELRFLKLCIQNNSDQPHKKL